MSDRMQNTVNKLIIWMLYMQLAEDTKLNYESCCSSLFQLIERNNAHIDFVFEFSADMIGVTAKILKSSFKKCYGLLYRISQIKRY